MAFQQLLNPHWWQNRLKYNPLVQRVFLARNLSNRFPAMLNIEVTNACNLDCSFCPRKLTNRKIGFISEDLFGKIIDELSTRGRIEVLYLMKDGEPLMHLRIDKLINYAHEKCVAKRIEIYTNGILLDRAMGERLIKSGLDVLTVSLDAASAETYKRLKGADAYRKVVDQVRDFARLKKRLGSKKPLLAVKMVRVSENEKEMRKFKKLWIGAADDVIVQEMHEWEGSIKSSKFKVQSSKLRERYPCNLPWLAPAINWDGKVVPCCVNFRENELVMGNVSKNSLAEIYTGPKLQELRKAHLRQDYSEFPTCERCSYWKMLPNMNGWLKVIER